MSLSGKRTFVGFGFGPIQAGLFLYEAFHSGNFRRLIVAEVMPSAVKALRQSAGWYAVNVAHGSGVEVEQIGPVEIANPEDERDREFLVSAVAEADEIATALPSVRHYVSRSSGSAHQVLKKGFQRKALSCGPPAVVYTAENHNHAAEILEAAVLKEVSPQEGDRMRSRALFLNTVIGKMSGVVTELGEIRERNLTTVTPHEPRAFLVESFNRILISKIAGGKEFSQFGFRRGIEVFEEKPDLLPFEEAKLYGHNSTHAVAAYLGMMLGAKRIADLGEFAAVRAFLEQAFVQESGEALIRRHQGVDPLFTPAGFGAYATDLLARMFNPHLGDTVDRVGRDPARKLEWDDRLVGTMRIALRQGVNPQRYALGTAAAVVAADPGACESPQVLQNLLDRLWSPAAPDPLEKERVLGVVEGGRGRLRRWRERGFPDLEWYLGQ